MSLPTDNHINTMLTQEQQRNRLYTLTSEKSQSSLILNDEEQSSRLDILTSEQQNVLKSLQNGYNIFLTGPAGTGKSFVINHIIIFCKENHKKYQITSTTGISSILIGGITLHSMAGIQLGDKDLEYYIKTIRPDKINMWRNLDVLIIDEISMLNSQYFDKLNTLVKRLRGNQNPFGGIQMILSGDFLQLPPIKSLYLFETITWDELEPITHMLTKNMRLQSIEADNIYGIHNLLLDVRKGIFNDKIKQILDSRCIKPLKDMEIKPTKIFPIRATVERINSKELNKLQNINSFCCRITIVNIKLGIKQKFNINDQIDIKLKARPNDKSGFKDMDNFRINNETINRLWRDFQCMKELDIAVGAQVMLTKNIDLSLGLANGSRGIVREIDIEHNIIKVEFMNSLIRDITPLVFESSLHINKILGKTVVQIKQFPLLLAWACTVHKIQGASLDYVEMDMTNAFECGMVYTALSRIRRLDGLYITAIDYSKICANKKALEFYKNIQKN